MSGTPRTSEIIRQGVQHWLEEAYVCRPGTVQAYDREAQTADVLPSLRWRRRTRDGEEVVEPRLIKSVPVAFPQGGGYAVTFPLTKGDPVLLVFSDRSIDEWTRDGPGVVDVRARGSHRQTDAIAIPGVRPAADPLADAAHASNLVIGLDGGTQIHVTPGGEIHLGGGTHGAARADRVETQLTALSNALDAAITAGIGAGVPGDGGTAALTAMQASLQAALAAWPGSTSANKVKAD